jgi:hypothetical protein
MDAINQIAMTDIFIRSYRGDFEWLRYCVRSIRKYASGFGGVVIAVPKQDVELADPDWNVIGVEDRGDGYMAQQVTKMHADTYCTGDYIMHIDSDCCLEDRITPDMFFRDGKPIYLFTHYSSLKTGKEDEFTWQKATEDALGEPVEFEFMRRHPMLYRRDIYPFARNMLASRNGDIEHYILGRKTAGFSEFNYLGAIAYKHFHDAYHWVQTELGFEPVPVVQRWSWGGITDDIKSKLEEACK